MTWRRFFRRAYTDRESAEELRSYLEIETDDNIARGMSPEVARRAAHVKLGNTVGIRVCVIKSHATAVRIRCGSPTGRRSTSIATTRCFGSR